MKTIISISFIFFAIISCKKKHAKLVSFDSKEEKEVFIERADSINEEFLSKAIYDTAIFYNNSPIAQGDFLLNEKKLFFEYKQLDHYFNKTEKQMPIPIKEVVWKLNAIDFIRVCYVKVDSVLKPVQVVVYNESIRY